MTWIFGPSPQPGVVTRWEIASGHPGGWRVMRYQDGYGHTAQEYSSRTGNRRLYQTPEAAQKVADALNSTQETTNGNHPQD